MRRPFVHEVELTCGPDTDPRAPGGAVTEELCGSLDHEPPCPLASHFTSSVRREGTNLVDVRVLFAAEPADEALVRDRIDASLARQWQLVASRPGVVGDAETEHAARLVATS